MSRRRNETDAQWMERVRAAREYCNRVPFGADSQRENELRAFMSLFFPNEPRRTVDSLVREANRAATGEGR